MMAEKARLFKDHRARELIMSSPGPSAHEHIGRGVRNFGSAVWDREKKNAVLSGTYAKFTQNPAVLITPFEPWQQASGRSLPSGSNVGH